MTATSIQTSRSRKLIGASGLNGTNAHSSEAPSSSKPLSSWSVVTSHRVGKRNSRPRDSHWEPKYPFDLVIMYEDDVTRNRALSVYDDLVEELRDDHDIRLSSWQFQQMHDPCTLETAVDATLEAELVILSLNHGKRPSRIVQTWIEGWLPEKNGRHCALVVLVENAPSLRREDCPMLDYFFSAAHRVQMGFFWHVVPVPPVEADKPFGNLADRKRFMTPLFGGIMRDSVGYCDWGINEY